MDRIKAQPSIVVCLARLTESSIETHERFTGTHKYSGADIYTSVQRGVALQNVGETRGSKLAAPSRINFLWVKITDAGQHRRKQVSALLRQ